MIRQDFLPLSRPFMGEEESRAVAEVLASGWWTTGPKVTEFENAFAAYLGQGRSLYCVGLNSCSAALHLALVALGIGPGDEVIVPTWTFAASALTVEWAGAQPVLCDVRPDDLNIDLESARAKLTPRTKAVMPVHISGWPCDMDGLAAFAREHGLRVVEDAAHAIGTTWGGRRIGSFSDVTCFSFYATKNLAMGEGGAAVSADRDLVERIRKLGYFGINKEAFSRYERHGSWYYEVEERGFKYNLDSLHAALGLVQLGRVEAMNARRREIADRYRQGLSPRLAFPGGEGPHLHSRHLFLVRLPGDASRDGLMAELKLRNIGTGVHFIPLHRHPYYAAGNPAHQFPVAEAAWPQVLSLPMFPGMDDADVDYVVRHVNELVG